MLAVGGTTASPALDVLLATGELQSAALVAAALGHLGRRTDVVPPWAVFQTDAVWGNAILHHLDLAKAGRELRRVLAPGGVAVFCEPWGGNPLLAFARRALPSAS